METRELTCIVCPMGCALTVELNQGQVTRVSGNTCPRGAIYGEKEVTHPMRVVTTSVAVEGGGRLSVKTAGDIPKEKIWDCVEELKQVCVKKPVRIGDVVLENVAGTGVAIVATKGV